MSLNLFRNKSFAIDLGNTNTLVSDARRILLSQPSYIVFDAESNEVRAVGDRAFNMFEKNHVELKPVKPMKGGVIADYDSASKMIRELIAQANGRKSFFTGYDNIIAGIPYCTTEVERRALRDALDQFNAFNHPDFGLPNRSLENPGFGTITSATDPRTAQLGLRIVF